jgi:DNA-binding MarR family transcriptional regulator
LAHPHAIPFDLIELLFFAYRDFVSDPDRILEQYGFGRAHHRVLHFVNRRAGLTIAALLDILQITKQSLNRVLKELIEQGYIESRAGDSDRRQRLLFPTPRGEKLALDLAMLQSKRITQALQDTGPHQRGVIEAYLLALINPSDRADIDSHIHDVLHRTEEEGHR